MNWGLITFSAEGVWRWIPLAALALGTVFLSWSYFRRQGQRWPGFIMKWSGLLLLCLCALEPQWTTQKARPGANVVAVMVDNSASLTLRDDKASETRGGTLKQALELDKSGWLGAIEENFDLRRYTFDSRLTAVENFNEVTFNGASSALGASLVTLADRFKNRPLAGILLFTDGNATDLDLLRSWKGASPVYPVIIGEDGPAQDLALGKITVAQSAFEDAPITIEAELLAYGCEGREVQVRLMDEQAKVVHEQTAKAPAPQRREIIRLQVKPKSQGLAFYRLEARLQGDSIPSTEATLANNSRYVVTDRGQGPYRILYVSGRPNWEYKFLQRSMDADSQLQLTGLIRVAKREPKFDFRGRAGETSNPLFRGFDDQSREVAGSYDQPVLVRLNTQDEVELRSGFPSSAEDLFKWHGIIIDDLEAGFFTTAQATLLQRFVSERGGGLLMLGGMESFAEGAYARTPIGEMLPVYLNNAAEVAAATPLGALTYELDREGWLQPWARLRDSESAEKERLGAMPPFEVFNRIREVKPGASVIATALDAKGQKAPALVVQHFGLGRTAALTVGDVWRWGMKSAETRQDMERAWRQLLRWLVTDTPGRVSITAETSKHGDDLSKQLLVRVRDAQWNPIDNASITVSVERVLGQEGEQPMVNLTAQASASEAGLSETTYISRQAGAFRAKAIATNTQGGEEGRAETGWAADPAAAEFSSLIPNRALLEDLAQRSGGKVLRLDQLATWAKELPNEKAPLMESVSQPLWHTPWVFLLALLCLLGEWAWRRTHGWP